MLAVLGCLHISQQQVHVFGYNWAGNMYELHQMEAEETLTRNLLTRYSAHLHPSPCMRRFSCDPLCDLYQSFAADNGGLKDLNLTASVCT